MRARATLKTSYGGAHMMRVNLKGKGYKDCDNKVSMLASEINAGYWEIEYHKSFSDLLVYRLKVGENGLTWGFSV